MFGSCCLLLVGLLQSQPEKSGLWPGIWKWITANADNIIAGVVASVILILLTTLFVGLRKNLRSFFLTRSRKAQLPSFLEAYRNRLNEDTFRIHHSWMKEGQTLEDILVPVIVTSSEEDGGIEEFENVWRKIFAPSEQGRPAPRVVITGAPGSGKSVSMRVAARECWEFGHEDGLPRLLPVLMTFADFRRHDFDIRKSIAASLRSRGLVEEGDATGLNLANRLTDELLLKGRILIHLDGLDELKLEDRKSAASRIVEFLRQNKQVPAIISCRSVPFQEFESLFATIQTSAIAMADFIPAAIKRFVTRWKFDPPKSHIELNRTLNDRAHLRELAKNPLMLTIICFLYSQRKYRLPDNRAQFYEVCTRALLEEWDQAKEAERSNLYERQHKEELLAQLAYDHMNGPDPDRDIGELHAQRKFREWMVDLGLKRADNIKVLKEIMHNSGLLDPLPPNELRFPHQTFLEYFAAYHFYLQDKAHKEVLAHYSRDPRRWREVFLLYCGLATEGKAVSFLIQQVLKSGDVELAVEALSNARKSAPETAEAVLQAARTQLQDNPSVILVEHLGHLAGNQVSAFADQAYQILYACLKSKRSQQEREILQSLILALMRRPSQELVEFFVKNFQKLDLTRVLPAMGEDALILVSQLASLEDLSDKNKTQWIESLRVAQLPRLLYETLNQSENEDIRIRSAIALSRLSKQQSFWSMLEDPTLPEPKDAETAISLKNRWTWPHPKPESERGKLILFALANLLAQGTRKGDSHQEYRKEIHNWILYLAGGLGMGAVSRQKYFAFQSLKRGADPIAAVSHNFTFSLWRNILKRKKPMDSMRGKVDYLLITQLLTSAVISIWILSSQIAFLVDYGQLGLHPDARHLFWTTKIAIAFACFLLITFVFEFFTGEGFVSTMEFLAIALFVPDFSLVMLAFQESKSTKFYTTIGRFLYLAWLLILVIYLFVDNHWSFELVVLVNWFASVLSVLSLGAVTPFLPSARHGDELYEFLLVPTKENLPV